MNSTILPADELPDKAAASSKKISRGELERMTSQLIRTLHKRSTAHRFKPSPETDSPRLQYARACIAAVQAYTALLRDSEIEELEKRITELEREKEQMNRI
jgi:hypothetical protein